MFGMITAMKLRITAINFRMNDPQGSLKRVSRAQDISNATTTAVFLESVLNINKTQLEYKGFKVAYVQSFECDVLL